MAKKRMVYVAGLDGGVNEEILHAAFIPFGDIKEVSIPKDYQANKARGFGFVDFEEEGDAAAAIENMDGAELLGKVIRCSYAKPMTKLQPGKAVWATEEFLEKSVQEGNGQTEE